MPRVAACGDRERALRAGLRGARLRPARPKGRKTCPSHLTVSLMSCLSPTSVCSFFARSCRRGTYFFTYGLPVASSRFLAKVRKRPLVSVRCSVPPGTSAIRASPMALGCCVGCATKKVSKKVAGNAIPRSYLPSDREIAHFRVCSLYPHFGTEQKAGVYILNNKLPR